MPSAKVRLVSEAARLSAEQKLLRLKKRSLLSSTPESEKSAVKKTPRQGREVRRKHESQYERKKVMRARWLGVMSPTLARGFPGELEIIEIE